ncbi:histidine phosphatase family protein [bacterium]|nr:MAG: histidine phosphatase family protein [bacterium]
MRRLHACVDRRWRSAPSGARVGRTKATVLFFPIAPQPATVVTFVRHAETVANATGRYNGKTLNVLSAKGRQQAEAVVAPLERLGRFDVILISPSERVQTTFAPYLRATRQQATVWPLLYECCTGRRSSGPAKGPLKFGSKITVPTAYASLYRVEPGHDRYPVAPDYARGLVQVDASVREFRARYLGKRVLLLGHSGHGGQFIHAMTGKWRKIDNTAILRFSLAAGSSPAR